MTHANHHHRPHQARRGALSLGLRKWSDRKQVVIRLLDSVNKAPALCGRKRLQWSYAVLVSLDRWSREGAKARLAAGTNTSKKLGEIVSATFHLLNLMQEAEANNHIMSDAAIAGSWGELSEPLISFMFYVDDARKEFRLQGRPTGPSTILFFELLQLWEIATGRKPSRQVGSQAVRYLEICIDLARKSPSTVTKKLPRFSKQALSGHIRRFHQFHANKRRRAYLFERKIELAFFGLWPAR